MYLYLSFYGFFLISYVEVISARMETVIDVDDILSLDFMPSSILMLENPEQNLRNLNESIVTTFENNTVLDGKIGDAFSTMGYHRKMMNEYLCRNFIAEQIVEDMTTTRIKRRLGKPDVNVTGVKQSKPFAAKDNLIDDEGSTHYKNWLTRSATLEDIYKHYENVQNRSEDPDDDLGKHDDDEDGDDHEEYDHRETDYAYQQPQLPVGPAKSGHSGPGATVIGYGGHTQ